MRSGNFVQALEARRFLSANLVADFGGFYPTDSVEIGSTSFFVADDGTHGKELWKSDGSEAGTRLVKDLLPGANGSQPTELTVLNGKLVFFATDADGSKSLWITDGTSGGTIRLADFNSTMSVRNGAVLGDKFIFATTNHDRGFLELWTSDGTVEGTGRVKTLYAIETGGNAQDDYVPLATKLQQRVLLSGNFHLWGTDGTSDGTVRLDDRAGEHHDYLGNAVVLPNGSGLTLTETSLDGERTTPINPKWRNLL